MAEDLFSIPPFLEGHLAVVMKGRDISVSSFLLAQNNLFMHRVTKKNDAPHYPEVVSPTGQALCEQWSTLLKEINFSGWHDRVF